MSTTPIATLVPDTKLLSNLGTSLRELVHNFRQRTLVLVKALMLQKRVSKLFEYIVKSVVEGLPLLDYVLWSPGRALMHIPILVSDPHSRYVLLSANVRMPAHAVT